MMQETEQTNIFLKKCVLKLNIYQYYFKKSFQNNLALVYTFQTFIIQFFFLLRSLNIKKKVRSSLLSVCIYKQMVGIFIHQSQKLVQEDILSYFIFFNKNSIMLLVKKRFLNIRKMILIFLQQSYLTIKYLCDFTFLKDSSQFNIRCLWYAYVTVRAYK